MTKRGSGRTVREIIDNPKLNPRENRFVSGNCSPLIETLPKTADNGKVGSKRELISCGLDKASLWTKRGWKEPGAEERKLDDQRSPAQRAWGWKNGKRNQSLYASNESWEE